MPVSNGWVAVYDLGILRWILIRLAAFALAIGAVVGLAMAIQPNGGLNGSFGIVGVASGEAPCETRHSCVEFEITNVETSSAPSYNSPDPEVSRSGGWGGRNASRNQRQPSNRDATQQYSFQSSLRDTTMTTTTVVITETIPNSPPGNLSNGGGAVAGRVPSTTRNAGVSTGTTAKHTSRQRVSPTSEPVVDRSSTGQVSRYQEMYRPYGTTYVYIHSERSSE